MSVYKPKGSAFFKADFQIDGRRVHVTLKTGNKKEALILERELRDKVAAEIKQQQASGNDPLTLDVACGRY